jgi:two-component system response regulator PilR (NtrC family)
VVRCGEWIGVLVSTADASPAASFGEIGAGWYGGATLRAAVEPARRLAIDLPVVIQGETGTGKEGTARAVHAWSGRPGPFVAVNCAALPAELAEAELFGYRKGAFTGAAQTSRACFARRRGGSIFLDEILDLPLALQPKLLRVLEDRQGARARRDARRARRRARHRGHAGVTGRRRREPPVPRRSARAPGRPDGGPLPPLARAAGGHRAAVRGVFCASTPVVNRPDVEPKLVEALCLYDWPLNVRELLLLARRLLALHGHEPVLKRTHLPERMLAERIQAERLPAGRADTAPGAGASDGEPAGDAKPSRRATDDRSEFEALIEALRREQGSVAEGRRADSASAGPAPTD